MTTEGEEKGPDAANRGRRATFAPDGTVKGSGAGAGGGGAPEDFDSDSVAGGGPDVEPHGKPKPDQGGDAPQHNSR